MSTEMAAKASANLSCELIDALVPERGALVVLAQVFIDETNTHDGPESIAIAGYIYLRREANRFSKQFKKCLSPLGLDYFHMKDCAPGVNEYEGLTLKQRDNLERRLIYLTRKHSEYGFLITVHKSTYAKIMSAIIHSNEFGSAYTFCLRAALSVVKRWADKAGFNGKFSYIFEAGADHQSEANRVLTKIFESESLKTGFRYAAHGFAEKEEFLPLGSADLLAWFHQSNEKRNPNLAPRKDFMALLRDQDEIIALDQEGVVEHFMEVFRHHPDWFDFSLPSRR